MMGQKPSVDLSDTPAVDAIQWTVARLFQVSLHDLIFGSTTLRINDYPRQLGLARMAALYLCRKRTGLTAAVIARAFNRKPYSVGYAMRVIERLLGEEPALGELLKEVERELELNPNRQPAETEDSGPNRPR
jgi:chromosomal replication initiation ATPase DnaA